MERLALFPGSFDPITLGHYDICVRAAKLFDKVYVAVGHNSGKNRLFPLDKSLQMIRETFAGIEQVEVISYQELTVDLCRKMNVNYIVRGIRNVSDFEYERSLADMNRMLYPDIDTVFFDSRPEYLPISSTIVRDLLRNKGDVSSFVPEAILKYI